MSWHVRATKWVVVSAIALAFGVSVRAVTDWVTAGALGDVAVSFNDKVQVFDNAADSITPVDEVEVLGTNGGLAFDASLNLFVTNTNLNPPPPAPPDPTEPIHKVVTLTADAHTAAFVATQDNPRSIVFAADGTFYVASPGSPFATIRRYKKTDAGFLFTSFPVNSVNTDAATCIGIDLAPEEKLTPPNVSPQQTRETLYYVSGGRTIRTITVTKTIVGTTETLAFSSSATLPNTLPNPGTACGLRLLGPLDARALGAPPSPSPIVSGMIIADARNIKRVNASGSVVETFNAGAGSDSQKNWIDVALDPDSGAHPSDPANIAAHPSYLDFWGVNAGSSPSLAKFRIGSPNPQPAIALAGVPRGVAVNGELRLAQTVQLVELTNNIEATATFLQGTRFQHSWKGLNIDPLSPGTVRLAIQAIEVTHLNNESPPCGPLNVDCRLTNFPAATPRTYSRERGVVYREIWRNAVPQPPAQFPLLRIGIYFPGPTDLSAGTVCTVNGTPRSGATILRDPWSHALFTDDLMEAFYGGDDGGIIRTRTNDSIVVDRSDAQYFLRIIKPAQETQAQLGRSMQIAVEVRDPHSNCNFVSGLNEDLVLTVTDITLLSPDKGKPVGDSRNILGMLNGNGLTWASTANQYRTNLDVGSGFTAGHKYRACVMSPAFYDTAGISLPIVGESCVDFFAKN